MTLTPLIDNFVYFFTFPKTILHRDKLRSTMEKLHVETEQDERSLEKFKEQKMEQTLDYNVRLSDLQQNYSRLAAKTLERSTYLRNIQEKSTEKR